MTSDDDDVTMTTVNASRDHERHLNFQLGTEQCAVALLISPANRTRLPIIETMGGLTRLYVVCISLGALCLFPVHDVLAFTSISHQQSSCLSNQRLVSPTSCENAAYQNDVQETSARSATAAEVSRRSALTTLTALALGGRALARKPEPSAATSTATASIAAAKEGSGVGATALQSRPPATNKGLAAAATLAAGWGSSADMPTYKARGVIAAAKAKAKAKATAATSPIAINPLPNLEASASGIGRSIKARVCNGMGRSRRIARAFVRVAEVIALALPAAILYPAVAIARKYRPDANLTQRVFELWLGLCMRSTERGGAVLIKLSQWAASRPDVFGVEFADKFKKLQDSTTPHKWEHTEKCLSEAYGKNWRDHLRIEEDNILGSGCIAQVYKGYLGGVTNEEGKEQPVAIKVAHPRVRNTIEKDLGIMRYLAKSMERLPFGWGEKLKWNNLSGGVEEFATMLEPQLDLRNEANHIDRFNKDFAKQPDVIFPELVEGYEASKDVLVETFCSGVTLEDFCEQHKDDIELRARMCELGARTMCEMIFNNNFVHSDVSAIFCALWAEEKIMSRVLDLACNISLLVWLLLHVTLLTTLSLLPLRSASNRLIACQTYRFIQATY